MSSPAACRCCAMKKGASPCLDKTEQPGSSQYPVESLCSVEDLCCAGRPSPTPPQAVMVYLCTDLLPVKVKVSVYTRLCTCTSTKNVQCNKRVIYIPLLHRFPQSCNHCVLQLVDAAYTSRKVVYPMQRSSTRRKLLCCMSDW